MEHESKTLDKVLKTLLVGKELSSVVFIHDYLQFHSEGGSWDFSAYTHPIVAVHGKKYSRGTAGYRDALCERIGTVVESVRADEQDVMIKFKDNTSFSISLRAEDHIGPEAMEFTDADGQI